MSPIARSIDALFIYLAKRTSHSPTLNGMLGNVQLCGNSRSVAAGCLSLYFGDCSLGLTGWHRDAPKHGDEAMSDYRLVDKKGLKRIYGIPYCSQHIARLEKDGQFPKRVRLGACRVVWYCWEIEAWIASRPR